MGDTGTELGADLAALWLCGRSYLPRVADAFLAGNGKVDGTAAADEAFRRTGTVGPGYQVSVPGPVQPAWVAARDALQQVMADTATNVFAAGDAMVHISILYATVDGSSAERLREIGIYEHDSTLPPTDKDYVWLEDPQKHPVPKLPGDSDG